MRCRKLTGALLAAGLMGMVTMAARGQGIIVDRRPDIMVRGSYEVREVSVKGTIREQVAEVRVSQTFHNPLGRTLEAEFLFPLPHDGAVQNFVLMVDGRELPGRMLPEAEARRIYESIVRRKRDPALLQYVGRGLLKTSVFPIPAHESRTVTMRYTQLCRRDRDAVEFAYPLGTYRLTQKPVRELTVDLRIVSAQPIKSIYSPSHDVEIERDGPKEASVRLVRRDVTDDGELRLIYDLAEQKVGATVLSWRPEEGRDGYFLLLASPGFGGAQREPMAKTVVFVLDKSGSMSGRKIEQARGALRFVLNNLREGDTFNIIAYDDRVEAFREELQRYDPRTRNEALAFVESIRAGGSTNIDAALTTAMGMLRDDERPSYVLFLTDGLPTAGERNEMKIARHATEANDIGARLVSFGVGFDVNARLLDRLSRTNHGASEYVKPDQDIEAAVSRFYARLTAPVLAGVEIELEGARVNRAYPRQLPDLFDGGQLVWVGRYAHSGEATVRVSGRVDGRTHTFVTTADLAAPGRAGPYGFIEPLWAMRRVGDLIDQIDLHGRSDELVHELVDLSRRYGILTPYTAFLADEEVRLGAAFESESLRRANEQLTALSQTAGRGGVAQRVAKGRFQSANRAPAGGASGAVSAADLAAIQAQPQAGRGVAAAPEPAAVAAERDRMLRREASVQRVANKTFYRKDGRWLDAALDEADEARAITIRQYSEAYFELMRKLPPDQVQYLAFDEPVTVELEGRVYRIEPADSES